MFLLVVPVVMNPASEIGVSLSVVCSGIPAYFLFVYWKSKPKWMKNLASKLKNTQNKSMVKILSGTC